MALSFGEDVALLAERGEPVVLRSGDGAARALVAPLYQGRVLTSTLEGEQGASLGWVQRAQVRSGARTPHMCVWGGEDRYWVGPEGGQHGIYFAPGAPFEFERWQVPEAIDWGAWEVSEAHEDRVRLHQRALFVNRSGARFDAALQREVRLLERREVAALLGVELDARARMVAFQSDNELENVGSEPWTRKHGLLSIWILGMFPASASCTLAVPFQKGSERDLGPIVRSDYFNLPGADRLAVDRRKAALFFRGDGRLRCKLGVPRPRARPWLGAWDAESEVLTLVHYDLAAEGSEYVDSRWMEHRDPYDGDVVNVYNDGPPDANTAAMGSFYELETSSAVHPLAPGEHLRHVHRTIHLNGPESALDRVAQAALGVRLEEIRAALS
jgi:Family of unknown function (DUF6786)